MDDTRAAQIRARVNAATPGPWKATYEQADQWTSITGRGAPLGNGGWTVCPEVATCEGKPGADADLIAHAPTDLADLLDEREQLLAVVEATEAYVHSWSSPEALREGYAAMRRAVRAYRATTGEAGQ